MDNHKCCNHGSFISANDTTLYAHKTYGKQVNTFKLAESLSFDSALNFQKDLLHFGLPPPGQALRSTLEGLSVQQQISISKGSSYKVTRFTEVNA